MAQPENKMAKKADKNNHCHFSYVTRIGDLFVKSKHWIHFNWNKN